MYSISGLAFRREPGHVTQILPLLGSVMLPDAVTLLTLPLQPSCNAGRRCNAPDPAPATLLQRSRRCNASDPAPATPRPHSRPLPCARVVLAFVPAILLALQRP